VFRRVLITIVLFCLATVAAPATTASAAPYSPPIPTATHITVQTHGVGHHVTLLVSVSANSRKTPTGSLALQLSPASANVKGAQAAAASPWQRTVSYHGGRIAVTGPALGRGSYVATAVFSPATHRFLGSHGLDSFRLGAGSPNDNPGTTEPGALPATGGPDLLWLLLGGGLLVAGIGTVVVARRRSTPA
jgi:LPXTG-motif cell wall-anchored protein